jgi:AcrR family transcriptional regulator
VRPAARGRRGEAVRAVILDAACALLRERPDHEVTLERIAERAGASKATVYRHWPSRPALLVDALHRVPRPRALPDTGSLRGDLVALVRRDASLLRGRTGNGRALRNLAWSLDRDERVREAVRERLLAPRAEALRALVARARERGEASAAGLEPDLVWDVIWGPLLLRLFLTGEPLPAERCEAVVDLILGGRPRI